MRDFTRIFLLSLTCVSLMTGGCKKPAEANQKRAIEPVAVVVAASRIGPVQRSVEVTGTLYGDEETTLSAKVPGRIVQVFKDVGDRVPAGEPLASIDRTDYDLAVAQKQMALQASLAKLGLMELPTADFDPTKIPTVERARLQSANAEAKFNRARQLFEQKPPLMSEQDYADLQTAFQVARSNYDVELLNARSQLAEARERKSDWDLESQRLQDTTVRAPVQPANSATTRPASFRYAIAARLVSVGEYVKEGTPLFRLVAYDPIKYRVQVPERFIGQVKVGQTAKVQVEAYPDQFDGVVARISPQVETATRTFQVEILIPNPSGRLQPGSFARGQILTNIDQSVVLIPVDAVVTFAGVTKAYTVVDGKALEMKIQTGQRTGLEIEVIHGLSGTPAVVVQGGSELATGVPVIILSPTSQPAATRPAMSRPTPAM